MTTCPLCGDRLLRHIRQHRTYYFCHHCWQEMPDLEDLCQQRPSISPRIPICPSDPRVSLAPSARIEAIA